ncbi:MAG: hypothetical protein ACC662_11685, partial [Planctomycetota bacterium]
MSSPVPLRRGTLRALLLAAVLAAGLGFRLPVLGPPSSPVAVVDISSSLGNRPPEPPADAKIALPWYAVADGVRAVKTRTGMVNLPREATRLGLALRRVALEQAGRDVWLFTDGRGTDGDGLAAARALAAAGGRLFVSAPPEPAADVALLEARAHRQGPRTVQIVVRVASSTSGHGTLVLSREDRVALRQPIELRPGVLQDVELEDADAGPRAVAYRLVFEPAPGTPDDDPGNDALVWGTASDRPSVLVWGDFPPGALTWAGMPFDVRRLVAWEPGALDASDLVVLSNVPWARIGQPRTEDLLRFVAGGGRLLLLGGPQAWQAGHWSTTPLEDRLSPLRAPRPEGTGVALILALDRSGSTGRGALAYLEAAAREAVESLLPGERLAVLPFAARAAERLLPPGWVGAGDP